MTNRAVLMKTILCSISFLMFSANALAINKCTDANGKVSYSDQPCVQGINSNNKTTQAPAVTAATQVGTDASHKGVLGDVYSRYVSSVKSGDMSSFLSTLSTQTRAKVEPSGEKSLMIMRAMIPYSLVFGKEEIASSGDKGVLKVKGMMKSFISGEGQMSYGTIEFLREMGAWKISRMSWSSNEDGYVGQAQQELARLKQESCAGVSGKPESLPEQDMVKLQPGETQIAKFALSPKTSKDVTFAASSSQKVMYRVALNNALRCKYKDNYPTGMSVDGKQWLYAFFAGTRVEPVNGSIKLAFRNNADEMINFIVVVKQ